MLFEVIQLESLYQKKKFSFVVVIVYAQCWEEVLMKIRETFQSSESCCLEIPMIFL